jgi:transcription elongation factor Elf1
MALYIELKYISFLTHKLRNFKKKDAQLWNFSCPICLDSAKIKTKARGYIYVKEQKAFAMCHNCGYSSTFSNLLEQVDPVLYSEYRLEMYREKNTTTVVRKVKEVDQDDKLEDAFKAMKSSGMERLKRRSIPKPTSLLDSLLDRLDTLPEDHEARIYCANRMIPDIALSKLYFIPNICDIVQLSSKYKDRVTSKEPRIVLPFFDLNGQLSGVTCRGIRGESLRYIVVKVKEDSPLVFGICDLDRSKRIYVTEGPIDSLFLPNSCAVGGTSMGKIASLGLPKDNTVIIFDNQPRNKDVCRIIEKNIDAGHKVVIWSDRITQKDINDMALDGVDYMNEIGSRIFSGLQAKMEFNFWRKC